MLDDHTLNRMNKLAFTVFLPLSLYYNIYTAEIGDLFDVRLLLYSFVMLKAEHFGFQNSIRKFEKQKTLLTFVSRSECIQM